MPLGRFFKQIDETVTVRVLLGPAAEDRKSELRVMIQRALMQLGYEFEGRLRGVTPKRTGRTAGAWQALVAPALDVAQENELLFRFTVRNFSPAARWIMRGVLALLGTRARVISSLQDSVQTLILDNIGRLRSQLGRVEVISQTREEITLAIG